MAEKKIEKAEKAKRGTKTAAQRAQEALDVAERVQDRAAKRLVEAQSVIAELEADLAAATKRRDYLAQNPDLPAQTTATTGEFPQLA